MERGIFVIVIGGSGSGKGVLMQSIREKYPDIVFPTSYTTRAMRLGEKEGQSHHFTSEEEFKKHIAADEFLEWAQYGGHLYGTLKSEVMPALHAGKMIMTEVDVQGARQIKQILPPEELTGIFIHAGSWDELEKRIRARAPITEEELEMRKKRYVDEAIFKTEADFIVENPGGGLAQAKEDMDVIIRNLRNRSGLA